MIPGGNGTYKVHFVFLKSVPGRTNSKMLPRGHFVTLYTPHAISSEKKSTLPCAFKFFSTLLCGPEAFHDVGKRTSVAL